MGWIPGQTIETSPAREFVSQTVPYRDTLYRRYINHELGGDPRSAYVCIPISVDHGPGTGGLVTSQA
jgi:hypothetical protein